MKEVFLQFVWQFQLYHKKDLKLKSGESIQILNPGISNDHSGPDFLQGHIHYEELDHYGNIEIHLKSSDWYKHGHQNDPAYDNIILHIVLEDDEPVLNSQGKIIPCLVLKGRIPLNFYQNYESLMNSNEKIACTKQIEKLDPLILTSMMERVLLERLDMKSDEILEILEEQAGDWEETVFQTILQSFGFKRNKPGFKELSKRLQYKKLKQICNSQEDMEAILFGEAGFLSSGKFKDPYYQDLRKRFEVLRKKSQLPESLNPVIWKFFRLRPPNFPTVRIAQLSSFLFNSEHLLSSFLLIDSLDDLEEMMKSTVSDYWKSNYRFQKEDNVEENEKKGFSEIGRSSIESIAINALIPVIYAYGKSRAKNELIERSLRLLEEIAPENNKITRYWKDFGFANNNAFDSQALIQLFNAYCTQKRCLQCNVGVTLVREH